MGQIITEEYKKGCDVTKIVNLIPSKPIVNAYLHFATDPRKAPTSSQKEIRIEVEGVDESVMAPTGKQFASADIICCTDNKATLTIPSVEYNLQGACSLTEDDIPADCETACTSSEEMQKLARRKEIKIQAGLYNGVLNRTAQIGFKILREGILEAHNSEYNFGQTHIQATTAVEKYAQPAFDPMVFMGKILNNGVYSKVTISGSDIEAFESSIKNCGTNECTTKGYIPAKPSERGNVPLSEAGVILLGYHMATLTPIYAVSAKVKDKVRDETTGKVKVENVDLIPSGMMIFSASKVIKHKFGALQREVNGVSMPRKTTFRQFKNIDKGTQLVITRLQTNLTPYVASFENVKVVAGLV